MIIVIVIHKETSYAHHRGFIAEPKIFSKIHCSTMNPLQLHGSLVLEA